jgi:poly(A) polymerase
MTKEQAVLAEIADVIRGTEYEGQVFVAGGFVRDLILGKESKDIDLVVTRDNGGIEFAEWITRQYQCNTTGNPVIFPRFGTAKFNLRTWARGVYIGDVDIEAVMPRSEEYTEGSRKPDVGFTSLEEDAKRRDFTVNSLFYNVSTGEILDYVGGQVDILEGYIRTAIDPSIIFVDDPLRMLRAIRFAVRFGWALDGELFEAIQDHSHLITNVSQERIMDELSKMLLVETPSTAINLMHTTHLLPLILPAIDALIGVTQNDYHTQDVYDHTMSVLDKTPADLTTRLTALFHDSGKKLARTEVDGKVQFLRHEDYGAEIAELSLRALKCPVDLILAVKHGVAEHMRLKSSGTHGQDISDKALRRFKVDLNLDLEMMLNVMHADNICHAPEHCIPHQIPGIRERLRTLGDKAPAKVKLPIHGGNVMEILNMGPGPRVGEVLKAVEEAWYENPELTREEALDIVKSFITIARSHW